MKKLIILIFFTFSVGLLAMEGKTFVYFINGDWHYQGPVYEEEGIRLKDQANVIYREMVKGAKKDKKNNYVLFYDPLGKGSIFNRKWVKLRVYKKGKKVFGLGLRKAEINANSPQLYHKLKQVMHDELGRIKKEDALLYYYGEHFPAKGVAFLDLGGEQNKKDRGISLSKVLKLVETVGPFHTVIFHTCYINALDYLGPLLKIVDQVIVPYKAILNTHLNWASLKQDNLKKFGRSFVKENSNEKYEWKVYGKDLLKLDHMISLLSDEIAQDYWGEWLEKEMDSDFLGLRQRGEDILFISTMAEARKQEVYVPLYDYINLINQYLLSDDGILDDIDRHLTQFPQHQGLFKQIDFGNDL